MATEKRLIDANVVLAKQFAAGLSDASGNYYGYADVVFADDIENAPTVDAVEVVHGRWLKTCLPDIYHCTNCKRATKMDELCDSVILRSYCPNCGAKMDGDGNA